MIKVEENEKIRIDKYLSEKLDLSRSKIQKLIDNKKVIVNNKFVSANYKKAGRTSFRMSMVTMVLKKVIPLF